MILQVMTLQEKVTADQIRAVGAVCSCAFHNFDKLTNNDLWQKTLSKQFVRSAEELIASKTRQ
jgi:hypothetical protein